MIVAGKTAAAAQHGVYGLLEALGFGFYTSQETLPDTFADIPALKLPVQCVGHARVQGARRPAVYDYLMGHSTWDIRDYKTYIDALSRMRMNMVAFYVRDDQPFAAYDSTGPSRAASSGQHGEREMAGGARADGEYFAGTGRFFARDTFSASDALVEEQRPAIAQGRRYCARPWRTPEAGGWRRALGLR